MLQEWAGGEEAAGRDWYRWFGLQCIARLAQLAERKALNLVVVGSSPTSGGARTFLQSFGSSPGRNDAIFGIARATFLDHFIVLSRCKMW